MDFLLPKYNEPNWADEKLMNSNDVHLSPAKADGIFLTAFI